MMPVEWPSIRSIARWVLPVLVGPRTAVTPAPRARASRLPCEENEMVIVCPEGERSSPGLSTPVCTTMRCWKGLCLSCGTSLERIAPESLTRSLSEFVHGHISRHLPHDLQNRVDGPIPDQPRRASFINGTGRAALLRSD